MHQLAFKFVLNYRVTVDQISVKYVLLVTVIVCYYPIVQWDTNVKVSETAELKKTRICNDALLQAPQRMPDLEGCVRATSRDLD